MEDTLTDCLVRVREDLNQLQKVRDYLETNAETEEHCFVTWRTIEAFNSILSACSSQNTPEANALDTLLDSFYFFAKNNADNSVWENFGFDLGVICVKILSAIERTEIFELLFCKLLSVISIICEHNSNVWKAAARQILNVFINKKLSFSYLEAVLKWYLCIIKNIKSCDLYDFSLQNLHLLKTLSLLVQRVGDFEIQLDIIKLIFLHLSKDQKLMWDFFAPLEKKFIQSLQFTDFEGDCRLYLNALNASRGCERKVYSISCPILFIGGCYVEPPFKRNSIWVDANKDSERVSIKYGGTEFSEDRVIYIQFSEILNVRLENDKTEGNRCLTIQTKSLAGLHKEVKNDDICLVTENVENIHEFVQFLEDAIHSYKKKRKFGRKMSRTMDSLLIDRNSPRKSVQDNVINNSETEIDYILPDVLSLFERANQTNAQVDTIKIEKKTPQKASQVESQQLSPSSFVESLNKHMGLNSPEPRHTFEDSIETLEFFQKSTLGKSHKLFRSPDEIFKIIETDEPNDFIFGESKENMQFVVVDEHDDSRNRVPLDNGSVIQILRDQKNVEAKFLNSQSQDYFQRSSNAIKKKKPCLPKLKRSAKTAEDLKPERSMPCKKSQRKSFQNQKKDLSERVLRNTERKDETKRTLRNTERRATHLKKDDIMKRQTVFQNEPKEQKRDKKSEGQYRNAFEYEIDTEVNKNKNKNEIQIDQTCDRKRKERQKDTRNIKKKESKTKKTERDVQKRVINARALERTKENVSRVQKTCEKKLEVFQEKNKNVKEEKQSESKMKLIRYQFEIEPVKKEEPENTVPSLLDPNGYAFQRWCKPTTSERSNFWLKKLDATQKLKTRSDSVFDFSDESDSIVSKHKKKKIRVVYSKRKCKTIKETKERSLREVKKILKNSLPAIEKTSEFPQKISPPRPSQSHHHSKTSTGFADLHSPAKRSLTPEKFREEVTAANSEYEFGLSSEDEEPALQPKKRELSEEGNSATKGYIKKKLKATLPKSLLSSIRRRLHKTEVKDKHHTDEIIQAVSKATNHLFNHFQRNDGEKVLSYLNIAEEASLAFDNEINELCLREDRIQRAILYYKAGCSVSNFCDSLDSHFSRVKDALKNLKDKKDGLRTVFRISDRLISLIHSEIEKSIESEWTLKKDRLMRHASVLGFDLKELK